ncbi:MAG TPA: hypothetical protein VD999_07750 [Vitreimonas sp.]|nr:hypothetical protein [Vitreimonas sp.]
MMHTTRDYSSLEGQAKLNAAIKDIRFYLSDKKFNELTKMFKNEPRMSLSKFKFYLSMIGIEGYPAIAWADYLGPEHVIMDDETEEEDNG